MAVNNLNYLTSTLFTEISSNVYLLGCLTNFTIFFRHLLGRFCYEVAELSWWERKMASTLFADPPNATMEEAKEHFMAAEQVCT